MRAQLGMAGLGRTVVHHAQTHPSVPALSADMMGHRLRKRAALSLGGNFLTEATGLMTCQSLTPLVDILLKGQRVGASMMQSATWRPSPDYGKPL